MSRVMVSVIALVGVLQMPLLAQPKPKVAANSALSKAELFIAIRDKNVSAVKRALADGADPNGRNWLDFTPLMWAAMRGNSQIVDLLLVHGAKLEDSSIYGTAFSAAALGRSENVALALLDKGAKPDPKRVDGTTPLMMAASNGQVKLMQRLLKQNCSPNKKDGDGATALIYAARMGQANSIQTLLAAGADINAADSHGRTALHYAAANGWANVVDRLIASHAEVNAKDKANATALLLAARYNGDAAIVRSLLKNGANASDKDGKGQTALALAQSRGFTDAVSALREAGVQTFAASLKEGAEAVAPLTANKAVENSLAVLQTGMKTFAARAQCVSCHHQGLGLMTLGFASQRGFVVDKDIIGSNLKRVGEDGQRSAPMVHQALGNPNIGKTMPAVDIGDISIGAGYIFSGLIGNQIPANPGVGEMALFVAKQQDADGHWGYGFEREPMQSSYVTTTALVLQVLQAYGSQDKLAPYYERAKRWLLTTPTPNTEDKASRLLGLKWVSASAKEKETSLRELLALQRADGGWAQLSNLRSDAYATGLALYALHVSGELPVSDPAYQRGIQYLLRTQDEDGSWYVNKRAAPANVYFDAGFPHGESQYSSFAGTCWATIALLQTAEPSHTAAR